MTTVQHDKTPFIASDSPPEPHHGAMPDTRGINYYLADAHLRFLLRRRLTNEERVQAEPLLMALGARVGDEIEDLAAEADRHTPTLQQRDKRGERVDEVHPSRAYRALERILYGEYGLHAMSLRPGVVDETKTSSLVLNDALIYLAAQSESGLFCPLSMTRAMARTLLKFAPADIVADYVPRLIATDLNRLWTGAMFMTEKQGGSDLGMIETTARLSSAHAGWWELNGEKWFCSNAGADLILTLARPENAGPGTRGLGLYLVPRTLPDGTRNAFQIERLKEKMGMRSFASGEVTFSGTLAREISGPGSGWLHMTEMLNITRLGCANAAVALARRSFLEALVHARGREAFGAILADLPLMREQLLDMQMDVEALTALFFEGSAQLDAADHGSAQARLLARILTPLAKFFISEEARRVVAEGMEVRGGNAYIEDWPNARLLRDVQVQALWEGTGNISALDVGRAILREDAGVALIADLRARLQAVRDAAVSLAAEIGMAALADLERAIGLLKASQRQEAELMTKRLTRQMARVVCAVLLIEDAEIQAREDGNYRCLVQVARYLRRYITPPATGMALELDRLPLDVFDGLIDWTPSLSKETAIPLLRSIAGDR
ncbi:MAG: Acyl-CoA dehydrogenase [Ktedonobacterales bacterium]|nr:MAG: Acyl-CoA dehydrogenase [Ktedonobacterales bacterium]